MIRYSINLIAIFISSNVVFAANFEIPPLPIQDPLAQTQQKPNESNVLDQNNTIIHSQPTKEIKNTTLKTTKFIHKEKINPLNRFTLSKKVLPKPPSAREFTNIKSTMFKETNSSKITNTEPLFVTSSKQTHNLTGSGLYQNIIVMNENVKQVFSSKKISVEIRGPVVMLRLTSISGSEIDIQILTESFHVETFVFHVKNSLPAQKFIVKNDKDSEEKKAVVGSRKPSGGQAIDTLISIANGKKPRGYKWIASDSNRREYMGLGIREIGSYKKRHNEFIVFALTNETTAMISIKEWDLHNSIVLGSIARARNVKMMSLDEYQIASGKTVIMYVGVHLAKKDGK